MYCFKCVKSIQSGNSKRSESISRAFTHDGFSNWKKGKEALKKHESSKEHKDATIVSALMAKTSSIDEVLDKGKTSERARNRKCFIKVIDSLLFLAIENIAIRKHETKDSKIYKLVKLRAKDDPDLLNWIEKKRGNYMSPEIQNEIFQLMGKEILHQVLEPIKKAPFFGLMCDEASDVSNHEQAVIVIRWVDNNFEAFEEFIGLYKVEMITSDYLFAMLNNALESLGLDPKKIRSQCYDGASNMSGKKNGVATQFIEKVDKRALFNHCSNHRINLAVNDAVKSCLLMQNDLSNAFEIITLVKWSPRREATLDRVKREAGDTSPGVRMLCPTRWTVKAAALKSILNNYKALIKAFQLNLEETNAPPDMKAQLVGIMAVMEKFETVSYEVRLKLSY